MSELHADLYDLHAEQVTGAELQLLREHEPGVSFRVVDAASAGLSQGRQSRVSVLEYVRKGATHQVLWKRMGAGKGLTADEATALWKQFQRLEEAGAFAVECEVIPATVMAEINQRTGMVTISLGSGPDANVMFLFSSDICGESTRKPRHARAYGDLAALYAQVATERVRALRAFRADIASGGFPNESEVGQINSHELRRFLNSLDGA